jgi:predicted outer membrane repeat protein
MILRQCRQSARGESGFPPRWAVYPLMLLASVAGGCGGGKHNPGPDGTPPATITDLTVLAADDTSITLGWTAPGDDGDRGTAARYDLRYSLDQLPPAWNIATPLDSLPAPRLAGEAQTADLFPLKQKQVYYFSLRTFDAAGNASEFSNAAQGQTGDPEPPGAVTDLAATAFTPHSVTLSFTAPGDDGDRGTVVAYDIRESPEPLTDSTWAQATKVAVDLPPHPAGTVETFRLTGLEPQSVHYYMVRGKDDAGKVSPMGKDLEVTLPVDDVPPAQITDLHVTPGIAYRASLTWTAPGDDGMEGQAAAYRIRYRVGPITDEATWVEATEARTRTIMTPRPPGTRESADLVELTGAATVSFAVRAVDAAGNLAPLSNPASVYVGGPGRTWEVNVAGTGDAPTVQAAIDSAVTGDIVAVGPGRYYENIDFLGKDITVRSAEGPETTILDGSTRDSSVVVIRRGETRNAVLEGFTITGGQGSSYGPLARQGGGVLCWGSSPYIRENRITRNSCRGNGFGAGMLVGPSGPDLPSPLIEANRFDDNESEQNGGGLGLLKSEAIVVGNVFENNRCRADGGGIWIWMTKGSASIIGNTFIENVAGDHGAGIYAGGNYSLTPMRIEENLFVRNQVTEAHHDWKTGTGVAIAALQTDGTICHNTLVNNEAALDSICEGGGLLLYLTDTGLRVEENIIVGNRQCGIACWWLGTTATMGRNLLWNNRGGDLGVGHGTRGDCPASWADSMIVADPLFCDPVNDDYHVAENSPAIQGGTVMGAYSEPGCGPKAPAVAGSPWGRVGRREQK